MKLKEFIRTQTPVLYNAAQKRWSTMRHRRFSRRMQTIVDRIVSRSGLHVLGGPFAGMQYVKSALRWNRAPMLIGCYESELHDALARLSKNAYSTIVDIGCAEGYYAVGLARSFPGARIYAFDIDSKAQELCHQMATVNGVLDRLFIYGVCDIPWLQGLPVEPTLIFSDCEGCELDILKPELIPHMRYFDLIVELHDNLKPGIREAITDRFSPTHQITVLFAAERQPRQYPEISFLPLNDQRHAVDEFRPGIQQWAVMLAKDRGKV